VNALQTIVSRELNPLDTAVLTVGKIEAGTTFNIIPDRAEMMGTVRTLDQGVRKDIQVRMRRIVEGLCETMRCKADFRYKEVLPDGKRPRSRSESGDPGKNPLRRGQRP
jgi:metal-dependent amidase/aminoacylase/carboxypeptidase family protein